MRLIQVIREIMTLPIYYNRCYILVILIQNQKVAVFVYFCCFLLTGGTEVDIIYKSKKFTGKNCAK